MRDSRDPPTDDELFDFDRPRDRRTLEDELHILVGVAAAHYDLERETIVTTLEYVADRWEEHGHEAFMMTNPNAPHHRDGISTKMCGDIVLAISKYDDHFVDDSIDPSDVPAALRSVGEKIENDHYAPSI